ncbi:MULTISPECIES: FAD-dependent monooxygenase [unclassified Pseudomonas]|uniref:FAD-dependent monooxygenase n=1 Tax=unclassified Pseudomonas TaxID=196821 RepID=UPI0035BEC4EC
MDHRIIIVGAGITGSAMARALGAKGIEHVVVEKRTVAADDGLAINLPGNAIAALDRLGLAEEVMRLGTPVRRREYRTGSGRLLFQVDEDAFWGASMRPHAMLRGDLLRLLASDLPEASVLRGCAIAELSQDEQSVTASLDDGRMLKAGLVIGADGVHSRTRETLLLADQRKPSLIGSASWRFMVPNPGVDCWTVFASAGTVILLMPVNQGQAYGWAMTEQPSSGNTPAGLESAFATFPSVVRQAIGAALAEPSRLYHSPLLDVRTPEWSRGRIVLAGDSAHAMAPVWAQGAALGLEDALVMAEELSGTSDWMQAIQKYEARRKPRAAHVQAATDGMSRAAKLPQWLRSLVLPIAGPKRYASTYEPLKNWV